MLKSLDLHSRYDKLVSSLKTVMLEIGSNSNENEVDSKAIECLRGHLKELMLAYRETDLASVGASEISYENAIAALVEKMDIAEKSFLELMEIRDSSMAIKNISAMAEKISQLDVEIEAIVTGLLENEKTATRELVEELKFMMGVKTVFSREKIDKEKEKLNAEYKVKLNLVETLKKVQLSFLKKEDNSKCKKEKNNSEEAVTEDIIDGDAFIKSLFKRMGFSAVPEVNFKNFAGDSKASNEEFKVIFMQGEPKVLSFEGFPLAMPKLREPSEAELKKILEILKK